MRFALVSEHSLVLALLFIAGTASTAASGSSGVIEALQRIVNSINLDTLIYELVGLFGV
jgi:type IV secretory pathway VirB2 component (pilin)